MELQLQKGSIKATRKKVQDRLGIPMGKTKLQDLEQRPANNPFIAEWEAQYSHLGKTTPRNCFANLRYIMDCLHTSKLNWKDVKTRINFYYRPFTFLCLLYLDSTFFSDLHIIRHTPAIRSWNTLMMRKRIMMETSQRCLGNLENQGKFNPEEEQIGIDLYKGFDVYIEPLNNRKPVTKEEYYAKIIEKFDKIQEERYKLVQTLKNGVTKFEEDQTMFGFCKQYKELFNDAEFNLYESSKDGDSDSDYNTLCFQEKENRDDIGKGKGEGGYEPKDDGVDVQDDVNNENGFEKENIYLEHDHFTQDQFWDKEFTDEDYEQLITQAVEDHKKKTSMTKSKRKTIKDMKPPDFVFETNDGAASIMDNMKTFAPQLKVDANVIDSYSLVLNHEEKMLDMFKWKKKDGKDDEDKDMSNSDELRHTDNTTLVPLRFPDTLPQRMIAETDPTHREEALTEICQNSVLVPETTLTICTTRLRGQLHTILEDMDRYLNSCLEELEAFMTLWDVKPRVEESSLETPSVDELITQLRQMCEDAEDCASNAQEEARQKRKEALEEVIQRIYRNNN
ncbi:hypothetical protein Tco_0926806 [Tanacetum coccineum]|uniref:Uncharacterized protein n=1 Tax=Tanacetum coccineum TaxID=301880 RepID=A0ABQ5DBM8_9ASTR